MTYLVFALAVLAIFHFIYESILAPSLRLKLRFELFALRDELRCLKMECQDTLDDKHFEYLQGSINTLISVLYRFDVATLGAVQRMMLSDPELKARIEMRTQVLDDCVVTQCRDIRAKSINIAVQAIAVNNGGCALYLLPVALCTVGFRKLKQQIKASLSLPAPELDKYVLASEGYLASSLG